MANTTYTYYVQSGDTGWGIANSHGITVAQLQELNPGVDLNTIYVGQPLTVPVRSYHLLTEADLKEKALALTSYYETSTEYPDNYGVTAGNFDGAGLSHGAIQYNFGSGTLQPIWTDLINNNITVVQKAIPNTDDYNMFLDVVLNMTEAEQVAWGDSISDPANKHKVIEPWATYFHDLGVSQASIDRQVAAAQSYFTQAMNHWNTFSLWSRRGYSLCFDIAVQSWTIDQATTDLIFADFAAMDTTGKTALEIETEKMVIIANRRADAVDPQWQESYRGRKVSIAKGSGTTYGGTLFMDTTKYDMILEPAFWYPIPDVYGGPKTKDYTVVSGDTGWGISQKTNTTVAILEDLNPGINWATLYVGQVIQVPDWENIVYYEEPQPEPEPTPDPGTEEPTDPGTEPTPEPIPPPAIIEGARGKYTYDYVDEEVLAMLHGKTGSRHVRFRYDLLTNKDIKIRELQNVETAEIQMNAFNSIKRTARFRIKESEDEPIDFLSNRIQPFAEFKMPDKYVSDGDGNRVLMEGAWVEFPLGVFLLSSPKKQEVKNEVYRDIEAYDGLVILQEDKFVERYTVKAGTKYTDAIVNILQGAGITKHNIEQSDKVLRNDVEYEPGTEKSKPISDFLTAINFTPLWVDDYGYFTSSTYVSPQDREPDYRYEINELSILANGMEEELDLYSAPNRWVMVYSDVDATTQASTSLVSTYTNDNSNSPTSTVSRGRTIVDYRKVDEIADQEALDDFVERIAFNSSQIFGKVRFQTAIMPFHGFQDVLYLKNDILGIDGKYAETSWKFSLKAGAMMEHEARKVVVI